MPEGGVSYISKNNVPKCKLHFGEVSKKVSYIYKGPPTISKPKRVGILDLFNAKSDTHTLIVHCRWRNSPWEAKKSTHAEL